MDRQFRQLRLSQLDRSLSKERKLPPRPSGGWIASVREALGLTLAEVGKHLRAPRQTVQKFAPDFPRYRAVSRQVREILQRSTDLIEPLSLDEAYLDVSENKTCLATATLLGFARS